MLRAVAPIVACAMMVTIVACSGRDPVAEGANNVTGLPAVNGDAASPDGAPPSNAASSTSAPAASSTTAIPAALQGRWGLSPGDCTSALGDAKGLLVINAGELRFYESRAVPGKDGQGDADSFSGTFAFTGEGQSWSKFEALKLQGRDLVRTETKPAASFTYAKCT
jgi:hypothetical protein